ncbi:UDP-galactopyranose mutase [Butyrivibrio sp. MC2013]|uniref:UDP-galactopyranose mutase n=1 Tax=Butyrivibrio sp. MC2013 TaxID=1280686 RepID=UPI0003F7568F|nr:UDP-galactopyranose mutase [Butyrivibrio sp. MC2013]
MKYDYLIVGAGLYGCVYARQIADKGMKCLVIDKRDAIGGNIRTCDVNGITVHEYGAHIFHTSDEEVWNYMNRFARFNNYVNSPVAVYHDELYNLPFNMNTFSKMWGIKTPDEARQIIDRQSREAVIEILHKRGCDNVTEEDIASFEAASLEEQGLMLAGRDIYEKLIAGYTRKQWGRPCSELPSFIIKRLPFRFIYDNNYFNDPYQGIPVGGYTLICEKLLGIDGGRCDDNITVMTGTFFDDLVDKKTITGDAPIISRSGDSFEHCVYTGMIDEFFDHRLGYLEYRSLRFETEVLPDIDNYQGCAVVNYTAEEVPYTRIIEHKHFEFGKGNGTVITREYPASWKEGDEPYYPMNDDRNNLLMERYLELADEYPRFTFGGRLGRYKYYNMDQVVRTALDDSRG